MLAGVLEVRALVGKTAAETYAQRLEEVLAMGFDLRVASELGLYKMPFAPWSGFLLILESNEDTRRPKPSTECVGDSLSEFEGTSIIDCCTLFCKKIVEQELFTSAALIVCDRQRPQEFREPLEGQGLVELCQSLQGRLEMMAEEL